MKNIHGGDIYQYEHILDFSANINPLGAPESVKRAIVDAIPQMGAYPEMYSDSLRQAIGEHYHIDSSQIICGNGAADVIYRYVYAVRPEKILVVAPCFAEYESAVRSLWMAGSPSTIETKEMPEVIVYSLNHLDFTVKADILSKIDSAQPDVVFLCNPNNPTGMLMPQPLLQEIVMLCAKKNIRFFLDECFLDFTGMEMQLSMMKMIHQYKELFILKAFTKMYAMAGVRLGFGLTADTALIERMYQVGSPWHVSVFAGAAGKAALREQDFVEKTVKTIEKEKQYLYQMLDALKITYWKGSANYILLKAATDLKERLIDEGILIRDCSNYRNLSEGYFRIAVKSHEDNMRFIEAMRRCL